MKTNRIERPEPRPDRPSPRFAALMAICLLISGFASTCLELGWTRQLKLALGSSHLATTTVLAAYMLGLGLGAGLLAGRAPKPTAPTRRYAGAEACVGGLALLATVLFSTWSQWMPNDRLASTVAALGLLTLPTMAMGAALPLAIAALGRTSSVAHAGWFYGFNTLGAVLGVYVTNFYALPGLGLVRTLNLAAALQLCIAVGALVIGKTSQLDPHASADQAPPLRPIRSKPALLSAYALVGGVGLMLELVWTRGLAVVLGSSMQAFASTLCTFLLGIALGSLALRGRSLKLAHRPDFTIIALALLALLGMGSAYALPHLPELYLALVDPSQLDPFRVELTHFAVGAVLILPSTLILGALFPLILGLLTSSDGLDCATVTCQAYFANALGAAAGACLSGLWLLPWLGLVHTTRTAALLALAAAGLVLFAHRAEVRARWPIVALTLVSVLSVALPFDFDRARFTRGAFKDLYAATGYGIELEEVNGRPEHELLFYEDGANATVSVHRHAGVHAMRVNGKADASSRGDLGTQLLLAHIPLLYTPTARRVGIIGYASGMTVGAALSYPHVEQVEAIELEAATIRASRHFAELSGTPLDDPRTQLVIADGRRHVASRRDYYDLLISEPSNPWVGGAAQLFTQEFFADAQKALRPHGRLLQWVQLYSLSHSSLAAILKAMSAEFKYIYAFAEHHHAPDLLLMATDEPLRYAELPRWPDLPSSVQTSLRSIDCQSSAELWSLMSIDASTVAMLAATAPRANRDDNLHVELAALRSLHDPTLRDNWQQFDQLGRGHERLAHQLQLSPKERAALAFAYASRRRDLQASRAWAATHTEPEISGFMAATQLVQQRMLGQVDDQAIAKVRRATLLDPAAPELAHFAALLLNEAGAHELSRSEIRRGLALAPDDLRLSSLRAKSLAASGRLKEAAQAFAQLAAGPRLHVEPDLHRHAARLASLGGEHSLAISLLEHELRSGDVNWLEGWRLLTRAYEASHQLEHAKHSRQQAAAAQRNRARVLQREARRLLWIHHNKAAAIDALGRAAETDPQSRTIRAELRALSGAPPADVTTPARSR